MKHISKWDERFLELAQYISTWSKDPSTKVGAVIVRPNKTIASVGYNGFPRGVEDTDKRLNDRETKLSLVVHAELNAILNAREYLGGYTLYVWPPFNLTPTCERCAAHIIQTGINRIVGYQSREGSESANRWQKSCGISLDMYNEAGVRVDMYEY